MRKLLFALAKREMFWYNNLIKKRTAFESADSWLGRELFN